MYIAKGKDSEVKNVRESRNDYCKGSNKMVNAIVIKLQEPNTDRKGGIFCKDWV